MSEDTADFTLPSNPADRRKIKDAIYEIAGVITEIKDKRSYITDAKKMLKEEFGLPPKLATKMAKTVNEHNFKDVIAESEAFEVVYENLFETNNNAPVADASDEE